MRHGDHRRCDPTPQVADVLRQVGDLAVWALEQLPNVSRGACRTHHTLYIEARTERPALAMHNHGAHVALWNELSRSICDGGKHRHVKSVHLVGAAKCDCDNPLRVFDGADARDI